LTLRGLAVLIAAAILLSGCSSSSQKTDAEDAESTPTKRNRDARTSRMGASAQGSDNETCPALNATRPGEPVEIKQTGSGLNGATKDWKWIVEPGYKSHSVDLTIEGPGGAPAVQTIGATADLRTDACSQVHAGTGSSGGIRGQVGGGGINMASHQDSDGGDEGNWTLAFHTEPGTIGDWHVTITVTY